jgi:hypothetical protein
VQRSTVTFAPIPGQIPTIQWRLWSDGTITGPYVQQNDTGKWVLLPPEDVWQWAGTFEVQVQADSASAAQVPD